MSTHIEKKSQTRIYIATTLFLTSIAASFLIAFLSKQGGSYWIARTPIPSGVQISSSDVELSRITLSKDVDGYLSHLATPVGTITKRAIGQGEILNRMALTNSSAQLNSQSISISLRSVDLPSSIQNGDMVSLYQLHDLKNGEEPIEPQLVLSPVFIESLDRKGENFGGEMSITVSLASRDVPTLLSATTSGRLVVVATGG